MSICANCRAQVEDGGKVCPECGNKMFETVVCSACHTEINAAFKFCSKCGQPKQEESQPTKIRESKSSLLDTLKVLLQEKRLITVSSLAVLALLFVVVASMFIVKVVQNRLNPIKPHVMYIKDNEMYFSFMSPIKPFDLTSRLIDPDNSRRAIDYEHNHSILVSKNGKFIFFPERINGQGYATYFYQELSTKSKNDKKSKDAIRIDTEVDRSSVKLSEDGTKLFYLKGIDRRLFVFDINENETDRIDSDVTRFYVNEAGTYIVYGKNDDTIREYDLMTQESERLDIDSKIQQVIDDTSKIYYIKDDSIFLKERGLDRTRISSNIAQLVSLVDAQNIYYTKTEDVSFKAVDFVDDDMQTQDQNLQLPGPGPKGSDYQVWKDDKFEPDWDAYKEASDEWLIEVASYGEKERRDQLRSELDDLTVDMESVDLYYHDGLKETKIAEGIIDIVSKSEDHAALVYTKYINTDVPTIRVSELRLAREVELLIRSSQVSSAGLYAANGDIEFELPVDRAGGFSFNNSGTALYYLDEYSDEKNHGVLTKIDFEAKAMPKPEVIDEEVASYRFGNNSDIVFWYKDVKGGVGDVSLEGKTIATDVLLSSIYSFPDSSAIAYFIDYSSRNQNASLYLYKDDMATKIADEVYSFVAEDNHHIAYLIDYRTDRQRGDAFLYDGSKEKGSIDIDVAMLIWQRSKVDRSPIVFHDASAPAGLASAAGTNPFVGTWYSDMEDNTVFHFRTDGTLSVVESDSQFEGRYAVDHNKLLLAIDGDDIACTFTLYGDTILLDLDHDTILLSRK